MKRASRRGGFTLVELLVVVGIIAVLVGILVPVLATAREAGRCTNCLSNLRQIGQAFQMYANDHNGFLVPGDCVCQSDPLVGGSPGAYSGAGSWAVILAEGNYLPIPKATATGGNSNIDMVNPFLFDQDNVLRCPDYVDQNLATVGYPTSQSDQRGASYVIRHSDFSHVAARSWYAINGAPWRRRLGGKPLPMLWIPDMDPASGVLDYHLNKISNFNNLAHLPLIFDGVWTFDFVPTTTNYDINRINARHYNGKSTNVLCADGHCETDATSTLPNDDWYCQ